MSETRDLICVGCRICHEGMTCVQYRVHGCSEGAIQLDHEEVHYGWHEG